VNDKVDIDLLENGGRPGGGGGIKDEELRERGVANFDEELGLISIANVSFIPLSILSSSLVVCLPPFLLFRL
jgi:hypothetical protein